MSKRLNSVGYIEDGEHWPRLVQTVVAKLQPQSVLDLGCGPCRSLATFKDTGVQLIVGLDGSRALLYNPHVKPHRRDIILVDLEASPCVFGERFDLVWSYEVAEHIANVDNFVETLTENAGKWIVMTAALPGQGGIGHVNCQPPEFWIQTIEARGFRYRDDLTQLFKALGRAETGHFDSNGLVFERTVIDPLPLGQGPLGSCLGPCNPFDMSPAPAPINIKIAGHYCCYKDKRATYESLKAFREHFPDAPLYLVSDNGDDFSDLAEYFKCDYQHYTESAGNGRTTEFDTHTQAMKWFRRLENTCRACPEADWIVILEDDVRTQGPIKYPPPAPMAGPCTMPFTEAAKYAIKLRHPDLIINGYSGCGGTIISREAFLDCMNGFYDIGQVALLDNRLARHSDAMLTYLFLWNGYGNEPWKDHAERSRGVGRIDAAFEYQFKDFYGNPWDQSMLQK